VARELDFGSIEVLTFDCYGTLIDWESGILAALRSLLERRGHMPSDREILETYAPIEAALERGPYRPYRSVLASVVSGFGRAFGFDPDEGELAGLADSIAHWEPFPDTVAGLRALAERYRLGVISNIDNELFGHSAPKLGVEFDWVITAQSVGAYKPSPMVFRHALAVIGEPHEQVLHVAQSLYHDIVPAHELGLATVWVDRRHAQGGFGATPPAEAEPDLVVEDLATLAELATGGRGSSTKEGRA